MSAEQLLFARQQISREREKCFGKKAFARSSRLSLLNKLFVMQSKVAFVIELGALVY